MQRELIKPPRLKQGDRVAVVSPSWGGPGAFPHRYEAGKRQLIEALGVEVIEMPHALADADWIYRNPQARADDLMQAFSDPAIHGIIASIGGDDSIRLIPYLDLSVISNNPKVFLGYSDTTTLHFACLKAGLVSFYGPAVMSGLCAGSPVQDYAVQSMRRALCSPDPLGLVEPNRGGWTVERLDWTIPHDQNKPRLLQPSTGPLLLQGKGIVHGRLIGGCAEIINVLTATPWWPSPDEWRGAILFYETSEDVPPPWLIRYWLRSLAAQGILQILSGILLGRPAGELLAVDFGREVLGVLAEEGLTDLPVLANLDFGHTEPIMTLPYGVMAEIDCEKVELRVVESAVV